VQEDGVAPGRVSRLSAKGGRRPPFAFLVLLGLAVAVPAAAGTAIQNGVAHGLAAAARPDAVVAHARDGKRRTGIALTLGFEISTADGGAPPALSRGRIEVDEDIRFDASGVDRCARSEIEGRESEAALKACAASQVGQGTATASCASGASVADPSLVLAVFNAGNGKDPGFLVHAGASAPAEGFPAVFRVRMPKGHAMTLPGRFADGNCTLRAFEMTLEKRTRYSRERSGHARDYVSAQCPAGRWRLHGAFEYEPNGYGVERLEPSETIPCRGKRLSANP
jgi:hypothetical protein